MANWSNSMDQCSIYQLNDEISYSTQAPSTSSHVLANSHNHHYKHEILQPSHTAHQGLRFQLQTQAPSQQIQNSNYHILSRHYLGQHQQQYHQHYQQHHQHTQSRQHVNISSSMPLNASKFLYSLRRHRFCCCCFVRSRWLEREEIIWK